MTYSSALGDKLTQILEKFADRRFPCAMTCVRTLSVLCLCLTLVACAGSDSDDASAQQSSSADAQTSDGADPYSESCVPITCEDKEAECGIIADGWSLPDDGESSREPIPSSACFVMVFVAVDCHFLPYVML